MIGIMPMALTAQLISIHLVDKESGHPLYNAHAFNQRTDQGKVRI